MDRRHRERLGNDKALNERIFRNEIGFCIEDPDEVYKKEYKGRDSTIYLRESQDGDRRISVVDDESGRMRLNSDISDYEYQNLINEGNRNLELTDLTRDPQTHIKNSKSISELVSIQRAKEQDILNIEDYRRPKLGEGDVDFVSLDGCKRYEIKKVVQNKYKSYGDSSEDIIININDKIDRKDEDELPNYLIDVSSIPKDIRRGIVKNIRNRIKSINVYFIN